MNSDHIAGIVRGAQQVWGQQGVPIEEARVKSVTRSLQVLAQRAHPLKAGETAIVSIARPYTAALLADRVFHLIPGIFPPGVGFGLDTERALRIVAWLCLPAPDPRTFL